MYLNFSFPNFVWLPFGYFSTIEVEECLVYRLCGTEHIVRVPSSALNEVLVNLEFMGTFSFSIVYGSKKGAENYKSNVKKELQNRIIRTVYCHSSRQ